MCNPSQYIKDTCSECNPRTYDLTLAKFAGQENVVEVVGDPDGSFIEYLYECCECGERVWIDDQWVRRNAVNKDIEGDGIEMTVKKMIAELETKFKSSKGFMGVYIDGVKTVEDLIENVKDEICSTEINLDGGYEEDLFGMTSREAKGYVKKLSRFVETHSTPKVSFTIYIDESWNAESGEN